MISDLLSVFNWWFILFLLGLIFLPLTTRIFNNFFDRGYIFSKTLGILLISYSVWLLGGLKILPFTEPTIVLTIILFLILNIFLISKYPNILISVRRSLRIFLFEEIIFLAALFFWSYVRAHEPSIHGLEKFMDFSFVNSILRADYFPPKDLWLSPSPINYYYFGHLITAVLTKLSGIDSAVTYNLMLATLFALTFTGAFSLGVNLFIQASGVKARGGTKFSLFAFCTSFQKYKLQLRNKKIFVPTWALFSGFLTAFLVTLSGNLQTIYAFFKPYGENLQPFWNLIFSPLTFPNSYWYPNATRFIPFTIHEFPSYSFVVSDLHSHVLDIPIVLLTIAILLSLIQNLKFKVQNSNLKLKSLKLLPFDFCLLTLLLGEILAVMYMVNAWDGIIYAGLALLIFLYFAYRSKNYTPYAIRYLLLIIGSILFSLPFTLNFKPFVSGIGVLCAPKFLTDLGRLGPFLFEAGHCQRSPFWQLLILYGFFYFWAVSFLVFLSRFVILRAKPEGSRKILPLHFVQGQNGIAKSDIFILFLILISTLLILIPEFIYLKDIYPAHYRANTMFKLTYQAFIMLSIVAGYTIVRIITNFKFQISNIKYYWKLGYWIIGIIGLFLVLVYPYFAIDSYYNSLKNYQGLNGLTYLKNLYPEDYEGILWLRKNIQGPPVGEASQPVILEANGESYTDFARVSANTGLPTVIGWPVHEWLWRGNYEIAAPRVLDTQILYETPDINRTKTLIKKYNISLVFIGDLERQKHQVFEEKFKKLGKVIFQSGQTKIYAIYP